MPFRGKRSNRGSPRKTMKNRKMAKPKVSKAVKTYVKKAIHTSQENKLWVRYATADTITTAGAGSNPEFINLVPYPSQSTTGTQFQRIGNKIKVVKAFIRGHVSLKPYSSTLNPKVGPIMIKMWLVRNKSINSGDISLTSCSTNFFEAQTTFTGFQGNLLDMELTNNKEDWIVYKTKTFELGTTGINTSVNPGIAVDNSNYIRPFYFSYGKHLRKQLNYDVNGNAPTNTNLFLITQAVYADGSSTAVDAAQYTYALRCEFEDA